MAKRGKRQLTPEEITKVEAWSAVRLPMDMIANLLDMGMTELQEQINKRDEVRRALLQGRAKASVNIRQTLYQRAVGRKGYVDPKTGEVHAEVPVDMQALKFWCETQEGFKRADKLELSGPEGAPIEHTQVSVEELKARVLKLRMANDLTEDE